MDTRSFPVPPTYEFIYSSSNRCLAFFSHHAIFAAYDRWDEHLYEFQFGKRQFDPDGPNYGVPGPQELKPGDGDARTTKLDDLELKPNRVFGYWFDFGDD